MVVFKCHQTEDTLATRKQILYRSVARDICDHLKGEPAYKDSTILVSDVDDEGNFYITLGGDYNKEQLVLDVTL